MISYVTLEDVEMAIRVLSGMLLPTEAAQQAGQATIEFFPHRVEGGAIGHELVEVGAKGPFISTPAKHLALRKISHHDPYWKKIEYLEFDIDDAFADGDNGPSALHVRWAATKHAQEKLIWIEEISYMIIGETAD